MPDFTQYTCPVCGREITPSDDIVVCPQCGAPHHRDCWKKEGHCHFQPDHGTPSQWKPLPERADEGAVVCGNCGSANAAGQTYCRKCGRELNAPVSEDGEEPPFPLSSSLFPFFSQPFSPPPDTIGGLDTTDIHAFIGKKAPYYTMKFQGMERQRHRLSWNWAAALFPLSWLAYRKMPRWFFLYLALEFLVSLPVFAVITLSYRQLAGDVEAWAAFLQTGLLPSTALPVWLNILYSLSTPLLFVMRMLLACFGNSLYRNHVFRLIRRCRRQNGDPLIYRYQLTKIGGGSIGAVIGFWLLLLAGFLLFCLFLASFFSF